MGNEKKTVIVDLEQDKLEQVKDVIQDANNKNFPITLNYISKTCDLDARSTSYAITILFVRGEIYTPNRNTIELTP